MEEILNSAVAKVAKYLVSSIGYVWNYKSNFDNLETEVRKLEVRRQEVEQSVVEASRQGEETFDHVRGWMARVQNIVDEASKVVRENEQANMKCFKGLCPNPKKRYQHSKEAAKKGKAVAELRGEGNFTTVSYTTIPKDIWIPSHKSYENFESRMSVFEDIQNVLSNPDVSMIGIYGMGGIGKTTLARKVAAYAEENKLFNVVAFAEVTMKPDIKEIQQEIADKLGLTFREGSASGRARSLQQRLIQEEKVFLILDNIWEGLKLEEVGIPFGDDHKGCKVLLTARSLDVLSNMNSQSNFQIDFLDEGEAWSLFKKTAGVCIETNVRIQALAVKVAKACGGLLIAITSVAVALKDKRESVWKNALNELQRPSARSFEGVAAETYASIEISFNQLRSMELKSIFLLCSIMGSTSIEDLLAYGMGLGMFDGAQTIEAARNRVIALVQQLKDSSLLLDANNKRFSFHDVIRDVARSIAYRDGHMIVETGNIIPRELRDEHVLRKCNKISLHAINELPMELECPQLECFYMKSEKELLKVPDKFFTRMPQLKVLHLDGMDLDSVSNSLCFLVNLQTLNIVLCNLHDFYFISELKQLKFLRIRSGDFQELPKEICNLGELRLLDLNGCENLRDIPPNVLSALKQLEELYLFIFSCSDIKWQVDGFKILDELKHLRFLTNLEVKIPNASVLPNDNFLSKKLQRYRICIDDRAYWSRSGYMNLISSSRGLNFNLEHSSWSEYIPYEITSVEEFLSILNTEGFPELEVLYVEDSSCFIECSKSESCDPFPFMKSLILKRLLKLEKIFNYQLKAKSFGQLTSVEIDSCNNLKNIFSFSTNRLLPLLQSVEVSYCDNMEEIFAVGGEGDVNNDEGTDQIEFKQLRSLILYCLPKLTNFYRMSSNEGCAANPFFNQKVLLSNLDNVELVCINFKEMWDNELSFQRLKSLLIMNCRNLRVLFSSPTVAFPSLEWISISFMDDLEMIWHNGLSVDPSCFQHLRSLTIGECSSLQILFSSSTVAFPSLETIEISKMVKLETIWPNQLCNYSFCNLKSVTVMGCNKLLSIFQSNMLERITRLEWLTINNCDLVQNIFDLEGIDWEKSQPQIEIWLRELHIDCLPNLEHVWNKNPQDRFSFQKLKNVNVHDCGNLKYLFPISIAKSLLELEKLDVCKCEMEKLVEDQGEAKEAVTFVFPQVISLGLSNLPKLQTFYQGEHTSQWPNLKELELGDIDNMESEFFNVQDPFPNLEMLVIDGNFKLILQCQVPEKLCCKIKFLEVTSDESVGFPLGMFQRFRNLQVLRLVSCSYQVLDSNEEAEILDSSLSKCDSKQDTVLHKIESLTLSSCNNLIQLVSSSVSFQNLTFLKVASCSRLKNLVMSSTAKSLVQLREMNIIDCESMIEVVAKEVDETEDNIIFTKLKTLTLENLSSLTCFCSGNHTFELPSLEELNLDRCPKMMYFSSGDVTTPMLQKVIVGPWWLKQDCKLDGDLNTTIQELQHSRELDGI